MLVQFTELAHINTTATQPVILNTTEIASIRPQEEGGRKLTAITLRISAPEYNHVARAHVLSPVVVLVLEDFETVREMVAANWRHPGPAAG